MSSSSSRWGSGGKHQAAGLREVRKEGELCWSSRGVRQAREKRLLPGDRSKEHFLEVEGGENAENRREGQFQQG